MGKMTADLGKTTFKDKLGYGSASLGDAVCYGLTGTFLLFFLTTIAGISPGVAGTITAVGAVWNAVINPVIGYFADKVQTRFGRRRPLIFMFSVPLLIVAFLLFTDIQMPMGIKSVYYGVLLMLFWTCFTGYITPYLALGVDYTSDYDDRTVLRLFSSFFNTLGSMLSMVLPTMLVEYMQNLGMDESRAWSATALFLSIVTFLSILVTVIASKDKDVCTEEELKKGPEKEKTNLKEFLVDIVGEYVSVAKLRPMKYLIAANLALLIGYAMVLSDLVYYFTFNMKLSAMEISAMMFVRAVLAVLIIPIVGKMILKTDRRETLIGAYIIGMIGLCIIRFADFDGTVTLLGYVLCVTICTSVYWQIMPGVYYDVCEYDRIINGRNRSATIVSFQGLIEALATGAGGQILGLILEGAGFDGEAAEQTVMAQTWIENSTTIIPIIFFAVGCAALYKYPLNKRVYNELLESEKNQAALSERKAE